MLWLPGMDSLAHKGLSGSVFFYSVLFYFFSVRVN